MTPTTTTRPQATLDQLREGRIDLGRGVSISAVMNESGRIAFLNFSHPTKDGGTCTKGLPIRKKGAWSWKNNLGTWSLWVERDRTITLSPSVVCDEHHVHGMLTRGRWSTFLDKFLDQEQHVIERKIEQAIKEAEEFGGGYWGAILTIASKKW